MKNSYEQLLIESALKFDSLMQYNDDDIPAIQYIDEICKDISNDKAKNQLCALIASTSKIKKEKLTKAAIDLKDCLIKYCGYKDLEFACNPKESLNQEKSYSEKSLEQLIDDLNKLIGLENVKQKVYDLIAYQKVQKLRKDSGLKTPHNTLHLAFTGNPGTGKTTVARIIGKIYKQIGLLDTGKFIEVSRTDLIAGYQGQTALKVKKIIDKARGGVLFIDEAYSITENSNSDSYGRECLTELTKALEDYRDNLVVIVAGYTELMNDFFDSNPGLKSRFNTFIEFSDYSTEELVKIFNKMCINDDYYYDEAVQNKLKNIILIEVKKRKSNGRFVRNLYETTIMNHSRRVSKINLPTISDLQNIIEADLPSPNGSSSLIDCNSQL